MNPPPAPSRRLPVGAEVLPAGGVHFRVWAPKCSRVVAVFEDSDVAPVALEAESAGYFSGVSPQARAGTLYRFALDDSGSYPDPASRFQPHGTHGPSCVVDPSRFAWTDASWQGLTPEGQVLYEMHVGTFTPEGTWAAAAEQLEELARLGVTAVEVMPVAEFSGSFGWGYDGVDLFAPFHHYGAPDDMRRFVDRAHSVGVGVVLDVVYNHFGPDGCYWRRYSEGYFTHEHRTDWGDAINFDDEGCESSREFFVSNAVYWVDEFHVDGLRLDATQAIFDDSPRHVISEITRAVRAAARGRGTLLLSENEPQESRMVRPLEAGGHGLDALWNDDFHHSAVAAITGHSEAYYVDYRGTAQELLSSLKWGYLYQGQRYRFHDKRRGTSALDLPATAFVTYLENHDQVANASRGRRLSALTSPAQLRAMTALMLLAPPTPMLFQGQEFASSKPFVYFADHEPGLAALVRRGRVEATSLFASAATPAMVALVPDPADATEFARCKLDFSERERNAAAYALHKDLLALRREDPVFSRQDRDAMHGAVLGPEALALRFFSPEGHAHDRLVLCNLGHDLALDPCPEPLLAPPEGTRWSQRFSSEEPRYGGMGAPHPDVEGRAMRLHGRSTVVLVPEPVSEEMSVNREVK